MKKIIINISFIIVSGKRKRLLCDMASNKNNSRTFGLHQELNSLRKALSSQKHYLDSVHETTMGLIKRYSVDDLLEKILTKAGILAGTIDTFLYLHDPVKNELKMVLGQGNYIDLLGTRIKPGQGLAGKVYSTGKPVLINNYATWSKRIQNALYDKLHSALGIPLKSNTRTIGIVGLGSFDIAKSFGPEDLHNMSRFAELASVALENARLNADLQKELNERKQAEKKVRILNSELEKRVAERTLKLEQAVSEIKRLKGIVPICSKCKKIRDDKGYWNILESYIEKYSDASFSHGICPDCSEKLYGHEDWYQELKKNQDEE